MSYEYLWFCEGTRFDGERFAQWSRDVAMLLEHYPLYAHWSPTPYSLTSPTAHRPSVTIRGLDGRGEPIVTEHEVVFNGDAATGGWHQPFEVTASDLQNTSCSGQCKTGGNPYDLLVTAALVRLTFYFPDIRVVGEDGPGGFSAGTQFCREVFGWGRNPELEQALQRFDLNSLELWNKFLMYPNLCYLNYVLSWYASLHPEQTIRLATLQGRVQVAPLVPHDPAHPLSFDIINETTRCVWNVQTGNAFEVLTSVGIVPYGSGFPPADDLAAEALRLARQFGRTDYHLGTAERDFASAIPAEVGSQKYVYFQDGSIMRVRLPTHISRSDGTVVSVKGLIAYGIIQVRRTWIPSFQIIEPGAYLDRYQSTEPTIFESKLLTEEMYES